jgi:hypothetical protein
MIWHQVRDGICRRVRPTLLDPGIISLDPPLFTRHLASERARNIRCVPNISNPRRKDEITLEQLATKIKPKNRGSNEGLRSITAENRFKGKVDWEAARPQIEQWLNAGFSIGQIAKKLGVSQSALSKANKRFGLYESRPEICPN